ncbi:MAG: phosphatase [Cyclobacteriaceae bacterium]|nr:phosphatase [Cyclobacteriaceae bacterium]MCH8515239.1 phosphatase [Cyclobacteriaceae bacterium]
MRLAAVDIGSNAIRMQITDVTHYEGLPTFKRLEYVRFPLRLGNDVFKFGQISDTNKERFLKLMHAFKILIDLYEVNDYMGCATSAVRESDNGQELIALTKKKWGLDIEIIDGKAEAEMINRAIVQYLKDKTYLHIDVGGGSTELNLYRSKRKINSQSFKVGSVRLLGQYTTQEAWDDMRNWVFEMKNQHKLKNIHAVGTGGNINKIMDLSKKKVGKLISLSTVKEIVDFITKHDYNERMYKLHMNADRADVIIPASEIYVKVMEWADATKIMIPDVGLKDGIMQSLYEKNKPKIEAI